MESKSKSKLELKKKTYIPIVKWPQLSCFDIVNLFYGQDMNPMRKFLLFLFDDNDLIMQVVVEVGHSDYCKLKLRKNE